MRRTLAAVSLWLLALSTLAACNTMEGVGKDTSAAGRTITDTSRDVRR